MKLTKEIYEAIDNCDKTYDGKVWYGITSTHIFCRPSCKSRTPKIENIILFDNTDKAQESGFRPCKRCKPLGNIVPDEMWVNTIKEYIEENYKKKLTLEQIADVCHGSTFHLLRVFKSIMGITPFEYQTKLRLDEARKLLETSSLDIKEVGVEIGVKDAAQFTALFKKNYQVTPNQYRKEKQNEIY